jgi:hypothetical protein
VRILSALRHEWFLVFSGATSLAFVIGGDTLLAGFVDPVWLAVTFIWLFAAVLGSALSVVRHAEHLAGRLGEPYGTLLLTLSVTFVEVSSVAAVMVRGENNPTLARDTLFAVVMIILNGMVGLSLLFGGWRHKEQQYNLQGANAYLAVVIPLVVVHRARPVRYISGYANRPPPRLFQPRDQYWRRRVCRSRHFRIAHPALRPEPASISIMCSFWLPTFCPWSFLLSSSRIQSIT